MNFDFNQISQLLNHIPYPIGKQNLVDLARQFNLNAQLLGVIENLPDKTYHNAEELQNDLSGLRNLGNLGGFKF